MEYALVAAFVLLALAGAASVRRLSRRLDALTQSYWELRYDYTRLRAQLSRLDPDAEQERPEPPPPSPSESFVPLSALTRKKSAP